MYDEQQRRKRPTYYLLGIAYSILLEGGLDFLVPCDILWEGGLIP